MIAGLLVLDTITKEVLQQAEYYLSVAEIARSSMTEFVDQISDPLTASSNEVLRGLLSEMERQDFPALPSETTARLLSLVSSIICLVQNDNAAISEIQLRLLRHLDSCPKVSEDFMADFVVLHFQRESAWISRPGLPIR